MCSVENRDIAERYGTMKPSSAIHLTQVDLKRATIESAAGVPLNFISVSSLMIGKLFGGNALEVAA